MHLDFNLTKYLTNMENKQSKMIDVKMLVTLLIIILIQVRRTNEPKGLKVAKIDQMADRHDDTMVDGHDCQCAQCTMGKVH